MWGSLLRLEEEIAPRLSLLFLFFPLELRFYVLVNQLVQLAVILSFFQLFYTSWIYLYKLLLYFTFIINYWLTLVIIITNMYGVLTDA